MNSLIRIAPFWALALFMLPGRSIGQAFSSTTMPVTYVDNTATLSTLSSPNTLLSTGQDDEASSVVNIGFDFYMNGTRYTQFSASSNGVMRLGGTAVPTGAANGLASSSGPLICPWWNDLNTGSNGYVRYQLLGTAPNRSLVVEWKVNEHSVGGTSGSAPYIFQARLFESTNVIWMTNSVATPVSAASSGYSYGISTSTSSYVNINNATPPTTGFNTGVNNTQTSSIVAGRRIIFTPSAQPTAPSGMSCTVNSSSQITVNWTDNATDELGYELYYSTNSSVPLDGTSSTWVSKAANSTSHVVTGLCPSTRYYFKVFARKEALSAAATTDCTTTNAGQILTIISTTGVCNNNSTASNPTDDYFTTDVTVTFTSRPASGNLVLSGSGLHSTNSVTTVAVASTTTTTSHTFVGVRVKALNSTQSVSAAFSLHPTCILTNTTIAVPLNCGVAQGSASCASLDKLCTNVGQTLTFAATVGAADASVTNPSNNYGCLSSSPRPTWYYIQLATSGSIDISLQGYDNTSAIVDNDFALWGPFANLAAAQAACNSYGTTEDCSYDGGTQAEIINIPVTATAGQVYVLVVTAYSASSSHFTLVQTGGTGSTECSGVVGACDISSVTATPTSCAAGLYNVGGTVTFANPPAGAGGLRIKVDGVLNNTIAKPGGGWGTSIAYSATGLTADGASHTVQAEFVDISTCLGTQTFTSPAACSSCSAGNMNLTITPQN